MAIRRRLSRKESWRMNKIYDLEGRNKAIVLFKFFAALLITYSHLGLLFPKFGGLVTGGAIGDGL